MPRNKDLKRLVRARMQKTGEAYTAARSQVMRKPRVTRPSSTGAAAAATERMDYQALAGMSDAAIKAKTGCTWERWTRSLDHHGAGKMTHGEIAALVRSKWGVDGWWSQMVTVGYERIKGLRARGQRLDGTFEASKSRTFGVPVTALFKAWSDARVRRRWLGGVEVRVRTATAPKSMRLGWSDGSIVAVWFTAKGPARSTVAVAHTRLPDRRTADSMKVYWSERLDALEQLLTRA
ncbi:MAG TPA: hypothetical protein VFZ56_02760 [Gemmatimonadaceae bacterium]